MENEEHSMLHDIISEILDKLSSLNTSHAPSPGRGGGGSEGDSLRSSIGDEIEQEMTLQRIQLFREVSDVLRNSPYIIEEGEGDHEGLEEGERSLCIDLRRYINENRTDGVASYHKNINRLMRRSFFDV